METVPVKKCDSISDDLKKVEDRIMQRAFEIFDREGSFGKDLDNWLRAERELVWKPAIELRETDHEFTIDVAVPGVDPRNINIEVTPDELLVRAEMREEKDEEKGEVRTSELQTGSLFRAIAFPRKVDTDQVRADFKNGMLKISAPIAAGQSSKSVEIQAA